MKKAPSVKDGALRNMGSKLRDEFVGPSDAALSQGIVDFVYVVVVETLLVAETTK